MLALIFIASFAAATISGVAGFGGALFLLPVLTGVVGIKAAVPILTIGQIFGNASRVWFGRGALQWRSIIFFLITAIPFTLLGSYLFTAIDDRKIKIGIGIFLILIVIYRRLPIHQFSPGDAGMSIGGGLTGLLSGLAGSAGPLGASFFLSLNLPAVAYVASEAFTALTMHLIKTVVYHKFSLIGRTELYYGLFVGIAMVLGSYAGKRIIDKVSRKVFVVIVEVLLVVAGMQMMIANLK